MKIKKIKIKNIRTHANSELIFEQGITLISGRTGSGKTSFLMSIEYGLFGNQSSVKLKEIMMSNAKKASIKIEVEMNDEIITIKRVFEKEKKFIKSNLDESYILFENKKNTYSKIKDFDQKILQLIGFEKTRKPLEIFEVLNYSRQGELNKIITMKREERQRYIDDLLGLEKYKNTAENLLSLVRYFEKKTSNEDYLLKRLQEISNSIKQDEEEQKELLQKMVKNEEQKNKIEPQYLMLQKQVELLNKEQTEKQILINSINALKKEIRTHTMIDISKLDEKQKILLDEKELLQDLVKKIAIKKNEKEKLIIEEKRFLTLNTGICPTCKQDVLKDHLQNFLKDLKKKQTQVQAELNQSIPLYTEKSTLIQKTQTIIDSQKRDYENFQRNEQIIKIIKEQERRLEQISKKQNTQIKEEFEEIQKEFEQIQKLSQVLKINFDEKNKKITLNKKELIFLEVEILKIKQIKNVTELIQRFRNDLKQLRELRRVSFLQELREELNKNFLEIRKTEEEYTAHVLEDYESVLINSFGEEFNVNQLSGGEKTSLALSYRLALSNLLSNLNLLQKPELLILDEPTYGFDKDDVNTIPELLQNLKMPQIILISHEEGLKRNVSQIFITEKNNNKSVIQTNLNL